jgi:hypothetical protein
METDGWFLVGLDEDAVVQHLRQDLSHDGTFTYRRATFVTLWDVLLESADSPLRLDDLTHVRKPLAAVRAPERGGFECVFVSWYPQGLAGGPEGWYTTPTAWLSKERSAEMFRRHGGPKLWQAFARTQSLLGLSPVQPLPQGAREG